MTRFHGSHWLERADVGDVTIVRLKTPQPLNEDTTRSIFDSISSLVGAVGRKRVVLNLAALEYLLSPVLGKLVLLSRKVQASDGRLALCQLSANALEVLELTHLKDLFSIYATEEEALQSFS
jgi:anti-sigma B factor antagonist